jgi:hypothetical protein
MRTLADSSITQCKHKHLLYIILYSYLGHSGMYASNRKSQDLRVHMHASISKGAHKFLAHGSSSRSWTV